MVRRLVIMGSGETSPGMLGVHREVFAGLPQPLAAYLLDSPFAFQENADELVERIGQYFAESLGRPVERITLPAGADDLALERALAQIRAADWLFAGPGSPSYARRCWTGTPVPAALAEVLVPGHVGALVFASAAAVTLGEWALPVYEIYKVGEDPRWEPGIGLMGRLLGWRCAVVPHYDNREGGTHDTRFCYLGGRRLAGIEDDLDGGFILGVDEHTALVLDLEESTARIAGRGAVTLRVDGREDVLPAGTTLPLQQVEARIAALGGDPRSTGSPGGEPARSEDGHPPAAPAARGGGSVGGGGDAKPAGARAGVRGVTSAVASQVPGSDASCDDLARTVLGSLPAEAAGARAALVALAAMAGEANAERSRDLAGQVVQVLVEERSRSRAEGDWAASDRLREALGEVGVEVRDTRTGSTWAWR